MSTDDRPHHLVVDPSVVAAVLQSHARPILSMGPLNESPGALDVRPLVETLTNTLTGTPSIRSADAMAGLALIALGTRSHHHRSAAVFVGVHAIHLACRRTGPWSTVEILPDAGGGRFAITVRRTIGDSR
jgi:hypothetical protein